MGGLILAGYAALLAVLAIRRRSGDAGAFLVNNRDSGAGSVAFSLVASCVGASATLGAAGLAFRIGTPAFWWLGCGAVGLALMSALLARRVRESGASTLPEMAETFFGRPSRFLISAIVVMAWTAIVAAQLTALSRLLVAMTGMSGGVALALGALLATGHAIGGGQAAVIRLDRWQTPLIAAGLAFLLAALWRANPGWTATVRPEAVNEHFTPRDLAGYLLVIGGNYLVCPMLFGRFFSARDGNAAQRGGWWAAAGMALFSVVIVAAGLACRGLIPEETPADGALLAGLSQALPGTTGLLVMGTLVAAVVSSADSCLVTAGTVLGHDVIGSRQTGTLRICVGGLALASLGMAMSGHGILDYLFMAYDVYVGGVVMPVFLGLLVPKTRRIAPLYAATAVGIGGILGLTATLTNAAAWSVAGMGVSALIILVGIALGTRRPFFR